MIVKIDSEKLEKWMKVVQYLKTTCDQSLGWRQADETITEIKIELEVARRQPTEDAQRATQ